MHLGAQYYRAPFPNRRYWRDDMLRMADAGLNTVQLWVLWGWCEPSPDNFRFDDYDELVSLAGEAGLGVVLSTIAELQPYWIHQQVPGSEMIDHMGNVVISSNRGEGHFGLTPGGCTDHPGVWERMAGFMEEVVVRYREAPNLVGWDAWNELRWNVNADGQVCHCPYTVNRFHSWLDATYGGLEGLNAAWNTRYTGWEQVLPGKFPRSPYTTTMAWENFLTWRATELGLARYDVIKSLDPDHPVTVHGGAPTVLYGMRFPETSLNRGNDWFFADEMDGIGCSSFPTWFHFSDADLAMRIECVRSAARGKKVWLSELQGGRAAHGFAVHDPVQPANQQRWVWTGIGSGADTILFWCWRDEVFGSESAGFGLIGADGLAEPRLAAMRKTASVLKQWETEIEAYRPLLPTVGVYFSPQSYYLYWNQDNHAELPQNALLGYTRALLRNQIPYTIIEEEHLESLEEIDVLFMPRSLVIDAEQAEALAAWVQDGGTLIAESECGAFGRNGLYRYPEDRFLADIAGLAELGRRTLAGNSVSVNIDGLQLNLPASQWITPCQAPEGTVLGSSADGPLFVEVPVGEGRVILCGAYMGDAYFEGSSRADSVYAPYAADFERFISALVRRAEVPLMVQVVEPGGAAAREVHVRVGYSLGRPMVFVFSEHADLVTLQLPEGMLQAGVTELLSGASLPVQQTDDGQRVQVPMSEWGMAVLLGKA
ncbi:MAG: beta-galactosidase [Chloroflexi bacterium]|nr:beta-galactosidase [Chloroflexota bacterium]